MPTHGTDLHQTIKIVCLGAIVTHILVFFLSINKTWKYLLSTDGEVTKDKYFEKKGISVQEIFLCIIPGSFLVELYLTSGRNTSYCVKQGSTIWFYSTISTT